MKMFLCRTSGLEEINGDVIDLSHFTRRVKGRGSGESGVGGGGAARAGGGGLLGNSPFYLMDVRRQSGAQIHLQITLQRP